MTSLEGIGRGLATGFALAGARQAGGEQGFTTYLASIRAAKEKAKDRAFTLDLTDRKEAHDRDMAALQQGYAVELKAAPSGADLGTSAIAANRLTALAQDPKYRNTMVANLKSLGVNVPAGGNLGQLYAQHMVGSKQTPGAAIQSLVKQADAHANIQSVLARTGTPTSNTGDPAADRFVDARAADAKLVAERAHSSGLSNIGARLEGIGQSMTGVDLTTNPDALLEFQGQLDTAAAELEAFESVLEHSDTRTWSETARTQLSVARDRLESLQARITDGHEGKVARDVMQTPDLGDVLDQVMGTDDPVEPGGTHEGDWRGGSNYITTHWARDKEGRNVVANALNISETTTGWLNDLAELSQDNYGEGEWDTAISEGLSGFSKMLDTLRVAAQKEGKDFATDYDSILRILTDDTYLSTFGVDGFEHLVPDSPALDDVRDRLIIGLNTLKREGPGGIGMKIQKVQAFKIEKTQNDALADTLHKQTKQMTAGLGVPGSSALTRERFLSDIRDTFPSSKQVIEATASGGVAVWKRDVTQKHHGDLAASWLKRVTDTLLRSNDSTALDLHVPVRGGMKLSKEGYKHLRDQNDEYAKQIGEPGPRGAEDARFDPTTRAFHDALNTVLLSAQRVAPDIPIPGQESVGDFYNPTHEIPSGPELNAINDAVLRSIDAGWSQDKVSQRSILDSLKHVVTDQGQFDGWSDQVLKADDPDWFDRFITAFSGTGPAVVPQQLAFLQRDGKVTDEAQEFITWFQDLIAKPRHRDALEAGLDADAAGPGAAYMPPGPMAAMLGIPSAERTDQQRLFTERLKRGLGGERVGPDWTAFERGRYGGIVKRAEEAYPESPVDIASPEERDAAMIDADRELENVEHVAAFHSESEQYYSALYASPSNYLLSLAGKETLFKVGEPQGGWIRQQYQRWEQTKLTLNNNGSLPIEFMQELGALMHADRTGAMVDLSISEAEMKQMAAGGAELATTIGIKSDSIGKYMALMRGTLGMRIDLSRRINALPGKEQSAQRKMINGVYNRWEATMRKIAVDPRWMSKDVSDFPPHLARLLPATLDNVAGHEVPWMDFSPQTRAVFIGAALISSATGAASYRDR